MKWTAARQIWKQFCAGNCNPFGMTMVVSNWTVPKPPRGAFTGRLMTKTIVFYNLMQEDAGARAIQSA